MSTVERGREVARAVVAEATPAAPSTKVAAGEAGAVLPPPLPPVLRGCGCAEPLLHHRHRRHRHQQPFLYYLDSYLGLYLDPLCLDPLYGVARVREVDLYAIEVPLVQEIINNSKSSHATPTPRYAKPRMAKYLYSKFYVLI